MTDSNLCAPSPADAAAIERTGSGARRLALALVLVALVVLPLSASARTATPPLFRDIANCGSWLHVEDNSRITWGRLLGSWTLGASGCNKRLGPTPCNPFIGCGGGGPPEVGGPPGVGPLPDGLVSDSCSTTNEDGCDPSFLIVPYPVFTLLGGGDSEAAIQSETPTIQCTGNGAGSCQTSDTPSETRDARWVPVFSNSGNTDGAIHVNLIRRGPGGQDSTMWWSYQLFADGNAAGRGSCSNDKGGESRSGIDYANVVFSETQAISSPPYEDCPETSGTGTWGGGAYDP